VKLGNRLLSYSQKTVINTGSVRHLEFLKIPI